MITNKKYVAYNWRKQTTICKTFVSTTVLGSLHPFQGIFTFLRCLHSVQINSRPQVSDIMKDIIFTSMNTLTLNRITMSSIWSCKSGFLQPHSPTQSHLYSPPQNQELKPAIYQRITYQFIDMVQSKQTLEMARAIRIHSSEDFFPLLSQIGSSVLLRC